MPYRVLQRRCKAAGLPANKTAAALRQLLMEHEADGLRQPVQQLVRHVHVATLLPTTNSGDGNVAETNVEKVRFVRVHLADVVLACVCVVQVLYAVQAPTSACTVSNSLA